MADASQLCLACGLCCSGALFDMVRVTHAEVPRLTKLGLPVIFKDEHGSAMLHPCPALDDTACTIYEHRPARCFWYRCYLLEALYADEVSIDEALGVVALAKELEGPQRQQFLDYHFLGRSVRRDRKRAL